HLDAVHHAEVDDRRVQLGVDHVLERVANVVDGRRRGRRAGRRGRGSGHRFNKTRIALENMPPGRYRQVVELAVLKALGDETRPASATHGGPGACARPWRAQRPADPLGLPPTPVRLPLARWRGTALVEVEAVHTGTVGRPQPRYPLAPSAPSLGFDPPAHALL